MKKLLICKILLLLVSFAIFSTGKKESQQKTENNKLTVFVSILPQKYFLEKIGGDRLDVKVMVPPGKSPHNYEPTPDQVMALGASKMFFTIDVPFENSFLPKIKSNLKNMVFIDTAKGIKKRHLESHSHEEEEHDEHEEDEKHDEDDKHDEDEEHDDHDDDHDHEEGADDPHTWMSPVLVKKQADNIYQALTAHDPEYQSQYKNGYNSLIQELDQVHTELENILRPLKGKTFFVYHPAFGYLTDEFGIRQVAIETGGNEPDPASLKEIIEHAQEEDVKVIFVQPEFSRSSAEIIAKAINGAVVSISPLNPDYINNLKLIASEIKKALQ